MAIPLLDSTPTRRKADSARRVRDLLRAEISARRFTDGQLPSETELMLEFGVGRNVVRAALAQLQAQGLVVRIQGSGTFVTVRKTRHSLRDGGVGASVRTHIQTVVWGHRFAPATTTIAQRLNVDAGAPCLVVESATAVDNIPLILTTSYLPDSPRVPALIDFLARGSWFGDFYEAMVAAGMSVFRREIVTEAVTADELVAADLDVPIGWPLMFIERLIADQDGRPSEYGFSHCRGDRIAFAFQAETPGREGRGR